MSTLHHLGCESCGSTLGVRDGQRLVRCTHCNSEYLALIPGFIPRFLVHPALDESRAQGVAKAALRHAEVDRGFAADAKVGRAQLYWVPFYEVDGLQVSTYVEKRAGGRADTRLAFVDFQNQGCAEDLQDWGLKDLRPRVERQRASLPLIPASPEEMNKRGHVLPVPPIPESASRPNEPIATKYQIVASGSKLLGPEQRYVYHPVWRVDVWDKRHPYVLTVDALSGDLLAGRLPQDRRLASLWLLTTLALFSLLLGRGLTWGLSLEHVLMLIEVWPVVLPLVGGILLALFIAFAVLWSEIRFRGEVVFSRHGTKVEKLGRPPETRLERWADEVSRGLERWVQGSLRWH